MNGYILSNIARLSYENEETFRKEIVNYTNPTSIQFFDAAVNKFSDAQLYILHFNDCIVFSVRGTSSKSDMLTDANFLKDTFQDVQYCNYVDQKKYPNIKVHSGFLNQYNTVKFCVLADVFKSLWESKELPVKIYLTSHSLGAAISTLLAACLKAHFGNKVYVENWTFGCPRVGNTTFNHFYNDHVDKTYRHICKNDLVPRIPRIGYSKFEEFIQLGDPKNGKCICLESLIGSVEDHSIVNYCSYFDNPLEKVEKIEKVEKVEIVHVEEQGVDVEKGKESFVDLEEVKEAIEEQIMDIVEEQEDKVIEINRDMIIS